MSLESIRDSLAQLHRSLLKFQKEAFEKENGQKLSPYDVLHLTINHADFDWLRAVSRLLAQMDEALAKHATENFSPAVRALLADPSPFKKRLDEALEHDPAVCTDLAQLKKHLS